MRNAMLFTPALACTGALFLCLAATRSTAALTITPLFEGAITGAGDAAQVEGAINAAIGTIESLYTNAGSIGIVFTQASGSFLGQSQTADYTLGYAQYTSDLQAASRAAGGNAILSSAVANLSSGNKPSNSGSVILSSADARVALGQTGASGCFSSSGSFVSGCHQAYDGVVTLSSSYALNDGTTAVAGEYSAIGVAEHEIDEILGGGGQGSVLNAIANGNTADAGDVGVLDLYRYSAPGVASFTTSSSASAYLSVNGGVTDIVGLNQDSSGDYADFSTGDNVQSAFSDAGVVPVYNAASPEFAMMESIGYDGVVPEPGSLAVFGSGLAGLRAARRRRFGKLQ